MISYEMDHWVLFDTLNNDQISRLKRVIDNRTAPAQAPPVDESTPPVGSFQSMLDKKLKE